MGTSDLYLDWDTRKNLFEMIFALLLQLVLYNVEAKFFPNGDYQGDYRRLPRMEEVLSVEDGEYGEDGEDGEYGEGTEKSLSGEDLEDGEDEGDVEDGEDLEDPEDLEDLEDLEDGDDDWMGDRMWRMFPLAGP